MFEYIYLGVDINYNIYLCYDVIYESSHFQYTSIRDNPSNNVYKLESSKIILVDQTKENALSARKVQFNMFFVCLSKLHYHLQFLFDEEKCVNIMSEIHTIFGCVD